MYNQSSSIEQKLEKNNILLGNNKNRPFYSSTEKPQLVIELAKETNNDIENYVCLKNLGRISLMAFMGVTAIPLTLSTSLERTQNEPFIIRIIGVPATIIVNTFPSLFAGKVTWDNASEMLQACGSSHLKKLEMLLAGLVTFIVTIPTFSIVFKETQEAVGVMKFFVPCNAINDLINNSWSYFEIYDQWTSLRYNYLLPFKHKLSGDAKNWRNTIKIKWEFIKHFENAQKYLNNMSESLLEQNGFAEHIKAFDIKNLLGNNNEYFKELATWIDMGKKWEAISLNISGLPPGQQLFLQIGVPLLKGFALLLSLLYLNSTACESADSFTDIFTKWLPSTSWLNTGLAWAITILTMLPQYATSMIYELKPFELFNVFAAWGQGKIADLPSVWRNHPILMTSLSLFFTPIGFFSWYMNDKFLEACPYNFMPMRVISNIGNTKLNILYLYFTLVAFIEMYDKKYGSEFSKSRDQMNQFIEKTIMDFKSIPLSQLGADISSSAAIPLIEKYDDIKETISEVKKECVDYAINKGEKNSEIKPEKKHTRTCFDSIYAFFCGSSKENKFSKYNYEIIDDIESNYSNSYQANN
jgi:hypothetical protein